MWRSRRRGRRVPRSRRLRPRQRQPLPRPLRQPHRPRPPPRPDRRVTTPWRDCVTRSGGPASARSRRREPEHTVTVPEFRRSIHATGFETVAERPLDRSDYRCAPGSAHTGARSAGAATGSLVQPRPTGGTIPTSGLEGRVPPMRSEPSLAIQTGRAPAPDGRDRDGAPRLPMRHPPGHREVGRSSPRPSRIAVDQRACPRSMRMPPGPLIGEPSRG